MNEKEYKPTKYFAERLNISTRTLFKEIKILNDDLEKYQLTIKKKAHFGIKMIGDWQRKLSFLNHEIEHYPNNKDLLERNFTMMKMLLLEGQVVTFDSLSENFFTSKTSIKNALDQIEELFVRPFSLHLAKTNQGTFITGEEADIQRAIYAFVFEHFVAHNEQVELYEVYVNYLETVFSHSLIQELSQIIEEKLIELEFTVNNHYKRNFLTFLAILLFRKKIGRTINLDNHLLTSPIVKLS